MDASVSGKYLFQKRNERIDWRKLAAVDVERIARDVDVDAIQENIVNVTYCNVEHELGGCAELDANVIKLFRLAQLTIEYLLHSQEFLQQCLGEKDTKIGFLNEELESSTQQCNGISEELVKRKEGYKELKKELLKAKKLIGDYQLMVRSGASGLFKCGACTKSFVSEFYLHSHMERRHPGHFPPMKKDMNSQHTSVMNNEVANQLDDIKARLKATEDELRREKETVHALNVKEEERDRELLDFLKTQALRKTDPTEEFKMEMEGYKNMMMKELKDTQKENETLKETLFSLRDSTEQWKNSSRLGNLEDDDDSGKVYEDLSSQNKELSRQLTDVLREKKQVQEELDKVQEELDKQRDKMEKLRMLNEQLSKDEQKYKDLYTNAQKIEHQFQKQLDLLSDKYESAFVETIKHCNEAVNIVNQRKDLTSLYASDVVDSKKPLPSPRTVDGEGNTINLWVSSNASINSCYRVSQKPASSKGDWIDVFSFRAFLAPSESFSQPVHVFSCGGSPYWRQYISLRDEPPTVSYKKECTFYASPTKFMGGMKLYILNTGGSTVIRSMLSKRDELEGWTFKGEELFVFVPKNSLNRSGTFNSYDVFRVSDDDVSVSSLTGTDIARDNLAQALQISRDLKDASDEEDNSNGDEILEEDEKEELEEEEEEENKENVGDFGGTSSGSFLNTTLLEKGEFYPFPPNMLAIARYEHSPNMLNAQREEITTIINDSLIKRGVDVESEVMTSQELKSKAKKHEKEAVLIEKANPGYSQTRQNILTSIDNYAAEHVHDQGVALGTKSAGKVVKTAVRFSDDTKRSPEDESEASLLPAPVVPKFSPEPVQAVGVKSPMSPDDDEDDESSSEWNSEELDNQLTNPLKASSSLGGSSRPMSPNELNTSAHRTSQECPEDDVQRMSVDNEDLSESEWDSSKLSNKNLQESFDANLAPTLPLDSRNITKTTTGDLDLDDI